MEEGCVMTLRGRVEERGVQCVGRAYLVYHSMREHGVRDGRGGGAVGGAGEQREGAQLEDNVDYLRSLDPKEWKEQDHYAVLGLGALRHSATEEDIKRAYRYKVLRHHPDKRRAQGEQVVGKGEQDYFTCITKAYEILGIPCKRRSYDSVDPHNDDSLPGVKELKEDFYSCASYFQENARWSQRGNVPTLGDDNTPREKVEKFYSFWYDFDSWREFSYHDEEDKEKGQDREERRWIEKQNKAVRAKKKKEEMARIRSLVDLAYQHDPRIERFKQQDKDKKMAAKKARQDAAQARKAEEERVQREEREAREQREEEERRREEDRRQEREALKRNMKKERKVFRDTCKAHNYYTVSTAEGALEHMAAVEKICEAFKLVELQELNRRLGGEGEGGREAFLEALRETEARLDEERRAVLRAAGGERGSKSGGAAEAGAPHWTPDLTQTLIKAVNYFPAGTQQRWEVIANFVNQHGSFQDSRRFSAKHVLGKAKDLQSSDFSKSSLKTAANQEAFDKFEKEKKKPVNGGATEEAVISMSFDGSSNGVKGGGGEEAPWSKMEQELLEQAIKTYPAQTPERWERIAECIPNRTKKECMRRFKELVDLVKAKKAALAAK